MHEDMLYESMAEIDMYDGRDEYDHGQDFTDLHDVGDGTVEIDVVDDDDDDDDDDVPF